MKKPSPNVPYPFDGSLGPDEVQAIVGMFNAVLRDPSKGKVGALPARLQDFTFSSPVAARTLTDLCKRNPGLAKVITPYWGGDDAFLIRNDVVVLCRFDKTAFPDAQIGDVLCEMPDEVEIGDVLFVDIDPKQRQVIKAETYRIGMPGCCSIADVNEVIAECEDLDIDWCWDDPVRRIVEDPSGMKRLVVCPDHDTNRTVIERMNAWCREGHEGDFLYPILMQNLEVILERELDSDLDDDDENDVPVGEFQVLLHGIHHTLARIKSSTRSSLWSVFDATLVEFTKSAADTVRIGDHLRSLYGEMDDSCANIWINAYWPSAAGADITLELLDRMAEWVDDDPEGFVCGDVNTLALRLEVLGQLAPAEMQVDMSGVHSESVLFERGVSAYVSLGKHHEEVGGDFVMGALKVLGWDRDRWAESRKNWTVGQLRASASGQPLPIPEPPRNKLH